MDIRIINPNTTASMTALIGRCAQAAAASGTRITAVSPKMGPASIESHYDEALSVPGILEEIRHVHFHCMAQSIDFVCCDSVRLCRQNILNSCSAQSTAFNQIFSQHFLLEA